MKFYKMFLTAAPLVSLLQLQAATPAESIRLNPPTASVRLGSTLQLSVSTTGVAPTALVWQIVSSTAGAKPNATGALGTISASGLYTAPAATSPLPSPNTVMVQLLDSAHPTFFDSTTITLLNPAPAISGIQGTSMNVGLKSTVAVAGTGFLPTSVLNINGVAVPAAKYAVKSNTEIDYTDTPAATASLTFTVTNPNPGGQTSNGRTIPVRPAVAVSLGPDKRTIRGGTPLALSVSVQNFADQRVKWFVNGKANGDAVFGTIVVDANGAAHYDAPATIPGASVTVSATSVGDPAASDQITVNLQNPTPVIGAVSPNPLVIGSTAPFTVTGTGFAPGAKALLNGVSVPVTVVSDTKLTVTTAIPAVAGRELNLKVTNPDPGTITSMAFHVAETAPKNCTAAGQPAECMSYADAVRFLEMATWGPTPASIAHLQAIGRTAWFAEQKAMATPSWPFANSLTQNANQIRTDFFTRALSNDDQLRQRMAFALSNIFVVSGNKDDRYEAMRSYATLLSDNAFGNYRTLLEAMTLNPAMGWFLDMANNDKANPAKNTVANENYAREVMQLFSIGLSQLNMDGSSKGTPTYTQDTVTQLAKVFTGWTYPHIAGTTSHWTNEQYFEAPMEAFADHHDATAKTIKIGGQSDCVAPGTSPAADLKVAMDCLAGHPSVPPFIAYRLIQRLVKSSPSPAYVSDIATVFRNTNGDLWAVVQAILTHSEAMTAGSGKLREPVLLSTNLLRALGGTVLNNSASGLADQSNLMGQNPLYSPSVFNYFSPFFKVAGYGVVAPEFQGFNATTGLARLNFIYRLLNNQISGNVRVDLSVWQDLASDSTLLVNAVEEALYHGKMDPAFKASLLTAAQGATPANRAKTVLYLAATAPEYQVEQ